MFLKYVINLYSTNTLVNFHIKISSHFYSTVTDFAKFLGLSTSNPFIDEI